MHVEEGLAGQPLVGLDLISGTGVANALRIVQCNGPPICLLEFSYLCKVLSKTEGVLSLSPNTTNAGMLAIESQYLLKRKDLICVGEISLRN